MNQFIMLLSFILSINFMNTKHPLSMGLNLLIQTILISILCGFYTYSYWFSYILFLIMLGGMLVLFLYVTSLANNEMFNFNLMFYLIMMFMLFTFMVILYYNDNFMWLLNNNDMNNFYMINYNLENINNLIKLYNNPTYNLTMLIITYLFLTLIIVVKITDSNQGPLRQSY